jgi:hypothetical protein
MTKRDLKKEIHAVFERKLRALDKREQELRSQRYYYLELEKPLFQGYCKYFTLRQDLKGRHDFAILQKLLPLIDKRLYSKTKEFTKRKGRKKYKKMVPTPHQPEDLSPHKWEKLTDREKSYFTRIETTKFGRISIHYRWIYPWMLASKVDKHFVTKIKIENLDVQSERQEIDNYLVRNGLRPQMYRLIYGKNFSRWWHNDKWQTLEKQIWKETQIYLNLKPEYRIDDTPPPYFEPFTIKNPKNSMKNFSDFLFLHISILKSSIRFMLCKFHLLINFSNRNF